MILLKDCYIRRTAYLAYDIWAKVVKIQLFWIRLRYICIFYHCEKSKHLLALCRSCHMLERSSYRSSYSETLENSPKSPLSHMEYWWGKRIIICYSLYRYKRPNQQLLLNLAEMWMSCVFQTLTSVHPNKYLQSIAQWDRTLATYFVIHIFSGPNCSLFYETGWHKWLMGEWLGLLFGQFQPFDNFHAGTWAMKTSSYQLPLSWQ
jgi:hypothetical protein